MIVKPALWRRARSRAVLKSLIDRGAKVLDGDTVDLLREATSRLRESTTIVACGGDGTVHLAVNAVAGSQREVAIVPMGTGNDIAGHFSIRGLQAGLRNLDAGQPVGVDLGHITCGDGTSRYFLGVASCGFDAHVNERANGFRGPQGTAKYLAALIAELRSLSARQMLASEDSGMRSQRLTMVAIGNTSRYGGGMKVCPAADAFDGKLTVTWVDEVTRRTLVTVLPRVFTGSHVNHPAVAVTETTMVSLQGEPFPVYADGERVGMGPVVVRVVPQALRVRLPA